MSVVEMRILRWISGNKMRLEKNEGSILKGDVLHIDEMIRETKRDAWDSLVMCRGKCLMHK